MQIPLIAAVSAEHTVHRLAPAAPGPAEGHVLHHAGRQRAGFGQSLNAQRLEETHALGFRLRHRAGEEAHLCTVGLGKGATLYDSTLEQALVVRAGHLGADAHAASRLAADGDVLRIAAERRNVALHPAGGELLIQEAEVGRGIGRLRRDLRVAQEAEAVQAVAHRHHHDTAASNTLTVELHLRGVAHLQTAAEVPDIHRQVLAAVSGRPHVEIQAVLAHEELRIHRPFAGIDILGGVAGTVGLHGNGAKVRTIEVTLPVLTGLGRTPTVLPYRRRSKGNALIAGNARIRSRQTAHPAVFRLYSTNHVSYLLGTKRPLTDVSQCGRGCKMIFEGLALHAAQHHAGNEVALQEGVHHQDRRGGHNGDRAADGHRGGLGRIDQCVC